ncbi:unnamed protein product [Cylindrotheca closterium]|uniref:Peptidase M6-like domain-containing protein n=1 Tax=Cylindrotheca closterium TaxID=2856 RepID=A0AAD2CUN4_9STRA|nr:unnamed protein product [Cylindrotheca closterium]
MKLSSLALSSLVGSFCFFYTSGHMADPTPFDLYDENGQPLGKFQLKGGDINSWIVDGDGYTVCHKDDAGRSGAHHSRHLSREHAEKMRALHQTRSHERNGVTTETVRAEDRGEVLGYGKDGEFVYFYCTRLKGGNITADLDLPVATTDPTEIEYLEPNIHKSLHVAAMEAGVYGECSLNTGGVCEPDDTRDRLLRGRELSGLKEGTVRNLVIPIKFVGHEKQALPSKSDLEVLMNAMEPDATRAPTGGVKKVFHDNSGGKLTLESTVLDWVQLDGSTGGYSHTEDYCTGSFDKTTKGQGKGATYLHDCLVEALNKIDSFVDFKQFDSDNNNKIDAITFIHSSYCSTACGSARDKIWSHQWGLNGKQWTSAEGVVVNAYHINPGLIGCSGSKIGTIATIAHETGHFLGLPDLYDRNGGGNGVGAWSLMASSDGFGGTKTYPPMLDPWSKLKLGWGTATELSSSQNKVVLQPSATNHKYYKISKGFAAGEYLLIENRQKKSFDSKIPEAGLMIWHIDEDKSGDQNDDEGHPGQPDWPSNGRHYHVALMQADGEYKFEKQNSGNGDKGDMYGQCLGGGTFGPSTTPNSKGYQGGHVKDTGITITNIYQQGDDMVFDVCFGDCASGSAAPPTRECCKDLKDYKMWVKVGATNQYYSYTCDEIMSRDMCDSTNGGEPNTGFQTTKPKDACCGCKGGRFASPGATPAPITLPPTAAPAPGSTCKDVAGYELWEKTVGTNYDTYTCKTALVLGKCDSTSGGKPNTPLATKTPKEACCGCNGSCKDDTAWKDKGNDTCAGYTKSPSWCVQAEKFKNAAGVSAKHACCICKLYY